MNKIRELRRERGWKQAQLGEKLNVKSAAISKYENGHIPLTDETISMLCDIFDVSADYLIGRTEEKRPQEQSPKALQPLIAVCKDLTEEEWKQVMEYIDFLKTKHRI